ncbi:Endoplasmic reticulum aminopeptidase 1, partial [Nowakowskiella sp. JEL0078]
KQQPNRKLFLLFLCLGALLITLLVSQLVSNYVQPDVSESLTSENNVQIPKDWSDIRLPDFVIPNKYRVFLLSDLTSLSFNGTVDINVSILKKTKILVLHALELEILDPIITCNERTFSPVSVQKVEKFEYVIMKFEKSLKPGECVLSVNFLGIFTQSLQGFYYSEYLGLDGKIKRIGSTQFESTDARRAFPCFDEPAFKATFEISIVTPPDYHAISNMPVLSTASHAASPKWKQFNFAETVKMSTYLVAFVVSDFESVDSWIISPESGRNISVRVWTQPGKTDFGIYALDVAKKVLLHYTNLFGIEYPLPKSDLVAIPDFAAGAMENWGLITYRDTALLYDPSFSSALEKQYVAIVVAHEIAHQWFGNLATMNWWSDLWLNEGFAE